MQGIDFSLPWYHGSQEQLTKLRAGSSNTQNRDLAKAFSHRPSLVSMSDRGDGEVSPETFLVRHNGETLVFSISFPAKPVLMMCTRIHIRRTPPAGSG